MQAVEPEPFVSIFAVIQEKYSHKLRLLSQVHYLGHVDTNEDSAIDNLFNHVDDMLLEGKLTECDKYINELDLNNMSVAMIVGVLTIVSSARQKLTGYKELVRRAEVALAVLAPKRVEGLLIGLR